jgi:hypothetical protein
MFVLTQGDYFRRRLSLLLLIFVVATLLYPVSTTVVPAWQLQIVDQYGKPLPHAVARQTWQHYSLETSAHMEQKYSDEYGYVTFPERRIRANTLMRLIGPVRNFIRTGFHSSYGPSSWVITSSSAGGGSEIFFPGRPLPTQIVIRNE